MLWGSGGGQEKAQLLRRIEGIISYDEKVNPIQFVLLF